MEATSTLRHPLLRIPSGADRPKRVVILLIAIVLLSLADLYITITYLMHFGMFEANPIARLVMDYHEPWGVVAWKLGTVAIAGGILFHIRTHRLAEFAAWLGLFVLVWLTFQWVSYIDGVEELTPQLAAMTGDATGRWVSKAVLPGGV